MITTASNKPAHHALRIFAAGRMALLAMLCGTLEMPLRAAEPPVLEYQVKAAFLVKFGSFVQWPAQTNAPAQKPPFVIAILGNDPFGDNFDRAIKSETVDGRPVQLRRVRQLSEMADCQVIFISSSESARMPELLRELAGRPVLTVSDVPQFARQGGMIGFVKEAGRVRFEINLAAANAAKLKLSAKLLQVGTVVLTDAPAGKP